VVCRRWPAPSGVLARMEQSGSSREDCQTAGVLPGGVAVVKRIWFSRRGTEAIDSAWVGGGVGGLRLVRNRIEAKRINNTMVSW
jgi:hypothetical protein